MCCIVLNRSMGCPFTQCTYKEPSSKAALSKAPFPRTTVAQAMTEGARQAARVTRRALSIPGAHVKMWRGNEYNPDLRCHATMERPSRRRTKTLQQIHHNSPHGKVVLLTVESLHNLSPRPIVDSSSSFPSADMTAKYDTIGKDALNARVKAQVTWILHLLFPRVPACISDVLEINVRHRPTSANLICSRMPSDSYL
jgi:hypothetical protein